ncbi:MAG: hypothetical protein H0W06_00190 [Chloroflexia bacterium]|nr:hypothetical protein [Chloroflexia bacterium]
MEQEQEQVWRDFAALLEDGQRWVARLIAALHVASRSRRSAESISRTDLAAEPFIGIWRGREEMEGSGAWVRTSRERAWSGAHDRRRLTPG